MGNGAEIREVHRPENARAAADHRDDWRQNLVFAFKSASLRRGGKIEVGPVQVSAVVRIPRPSSRSQSMPRDLFDQNDPFMDNFSAIRVHAQHAAESD
jgi:hypothetical protein